MSEKEPAAIRPLIRALDDDPDQLVSLDMLLSSEGWDVAVYDNARDFYVNDTPSRPGCLILDVRMPEVSGLEVQEELARRGIDLPIIFLTGHGDIDMAVFAVRSGAKDFLTKPVQPEKLLSAVARVVQEDLDRRQLGKGEDEWKEKFASLTDREKEIIRWAAQGFMNKRIALKLDISERTVQAHRLSAYKKLGTHSVADLAPLTVLIERGSITFD